MYIKLDICENNSPYRDPYEVTVFIKVKKYFATDNELCHALQDAYDEYYKSMNYKSKEEALDDGVCFGSAFTSIPKAIQKKYGFKIIEPEGYWADYDNGFYEEGE